MTPLSRKFHSTMDSFFKQLHSDGVKAAKHFFSAFHKSRITNIGKRVLLGEEKNTRALKFYSSREQIKATCTQKVLKNHLENVGQLELKTNVWGSREVKKLKNTVIVGCLTYMLPIVCSILSIMVCDICKLADIPGNHTNHSNWDYCIVHYLCSAEDHSRMYCLSPYKNV